MNEFQTNTRRQFLSQAVGVACAAIMTSSVIAAEPQDRWQLGCFTRPWADFDYRIAFDDIAAARFKHVGLMRTKSNSGLVLHVKTSEEEAAKIAHEAQTRGLNIPSAWSGEFGVRQSLSAGIEGLRHLIDMASIAGVRSLLLGGVTNEKQYQPYFKAVSECCDYAAQKRIGLAIKPHGGLNGTGAELRKCVELVGKKNFTIWYDAGNIFYYSDGKTNPIDDAPSVAGLVSGWCIKDFSNVPKKSVDITPGTGMVDFPGVLARLKKGGFTRGPLVVETLLPGERPQLLQQAKQARRFLEEMVTSSK